MVEGDFVAEGFKLGNEAVLAGCAVASLVEVVAAEALVGLAVREEGPGAGEDGVPSSDRCSL